MMPRFIFSIIVLIDFIVPTRLKNVSVTVLTCRCLVFFSSTHLAKQLQHLIVQTNSIKIVLKQFARKLLLRPVCHYLRGASANHFEASPSTVVTFIKACRSRSFKNDCTCFGVLAQITLSVYSFVSASLCIKNDQLCLSSYSTTSLMGLRRRNFQEFLNKNPSLI